LVSGTFLQADTYSFLVKEIRSVAVSMDAQDRFNSSSQGTVLQENENHHMTRHPGMQDLIYTRISISEMQYCWYIESNFDEVPNLGRRLYSCRHPKHSV